MNPTEINILHCAVHKQTDADPFLTLLISDDQNN